MSGGETIEDVRVSRRVKLVTKVMFVFKQDSSEKGGFRLETLCLIPVNCIRFIFVYRDIYTTTT